MPVGSGRYRSLTTASGKRVRLHFGPGGRVNEAKNLETGATHTPDEFATERAARRVRSEPKRNSYRRGNKSLNSPVRPVPA